MRKNVPENYVKFDYLEVLKSFISLICEKQKDNVKCVYLGGSYARGDATDTSDLDVFCIFNSLTPDVLNDVGYSARNTPVNYENLEINAQCFSVCEINSVYFNGWTEKSARILDSVLLFGEDIFGESIISSELQGIYKNI
jgi:predicted nucleotidyltransferase